MESRNRHSFAISRVVFLMNRTGGGKKHTRAGRKKWRVVDSLVKGLKEFFGMVIHNSRSGAFGRVLSYDGQTLMRSEDVGHRFDPFLVQAPFRQMPCAFGEVG